MFGDEYQDPSSNGVFISIQKDTGKYEGDKQGEWDFKNMWSTPSFERESQCLVFPNIGGLDSLLGLSGPDSGIGHNLLLLKAANRNPTHSSMAIELH